MKPYVICHMMPSVDGRLRTDRWDVPNTGHDEYERTADSYHADAWLCGRKTIGSCRAPISSSLAKRGTNYAVAIDTHGRLRGQTPTSTEIHSSKCSRRT